MRIRGGLAGGRKVLRSFDLTTGPMTEVGAFRLPGVTGGVVLAHVPVSVVSFGVCSDGLFGGKGGGRGGA